MPTITIQPDGEDRWSDSIQGVSDPFALEPDEIAARVSAAGIVGMGGATFPSAVKLNLRKKYTLHTLVINGAECEPYLTCDDRLMREHTAEVLDGMRIMAHALGVSRIVIGIENNKPEAQAAMERRSLPAPRLGACHGHQSSPPAHPLPDGFRKASGPDPDRARDPGARSYGGHRGGRP